MDNLLNCPFSIYENIDTSYSEFNEIHTNGFNFKIGDSIYLYGLIEGYGNSKLSLYFKEKFVSKICSSFNALMTDIEIKNLLYQTILNIENSLISDVSDALEYKKSGLAIIILLLVCNKIYVANTGSNIGLMCNVDEEDIYHIEKLNADHSLNSAEEMGRLAGLGIDLNKFKILAKEICPLNSLRIIGDVDLKLNFKSHNILSKLTSPPWSASPHVVGPLIVNESSQILLLFSSGLFESLQYSDVADVNKYLCTLILNFLTKHKQLDETSNALKREIIEQTSKDNSKRPFIRSTGILFCCLNQDLIGKNFVDTENAAPLPLPTNNRPKALTIEIPSQHDLSQNIINWQPFSNKLDLETDLSLITKTTTETTQSTSTGTDEGNTFNQIPQKLDDKGQIAAYVDFLDYDQFIVDKFQDKFDDVILNEFFFT